MTSLTDYLDSKRINYTKNGNNLSVGGSLDLRGTQITSLPDNLSVGGWLYYNGRLSGHEFAIHDDMPVVVKSSKVISDYKILSCQKASLTKGKLTGDKVYVACKDDTYAHGESAADAIEELRFKLSDRDADDFRNLPMNTIKPLREWMTCYRIVTGSCKIGVADFVKSRGLAERDYRLSEVIKITEDAYMGNRFAAFVTGGSQ